MRCRQPIALTIAGSDSGGGAGIQADLKTFAAFGVYGVSVMACLTAQNPRRVLAVQAISPRFVRQQLEAVFAELAPRAAKTGMLFSSGIVQEVSRWWQAQARTPLIVDPVLVATSGARLLKPSAVKEVVKSLFPLATLITPNLHEAEMLLGEKIQSVEDLRRCARTAAERWGCAVLLKGGHLRNSLEAIDVLYDGSHELVFRAPFIYGVNTHGTGCTYSAAITAHLALGRGLAVAVRMAKEYITAAIQSGVRIRKHTALNHFPKGPGNRRQGGGGGDPR